MIKQFKSESGRRLIENFISLSVLQVVNYILPLITLPYLVRVLKPDKFGLVAFAQAFVQYFSILTDYGFNLSATREISIHREDKDKVSEIFSTVLSIKIGLFVISLAIFSAIVFNVGKFRRDWLVYYLAFGIVVGKVLFPVWFFQGMERMRYITILNILAKSIFTVSIFVFVRSMDDYLYVPLLNSLGFIFAGCIALCVVRNKFEVSFKKPTWQSIRYHLREGWYIFISTVAISLYTVSNTFILGLFAGNTAVGYYSAAEKIVKALQRLLMPITQTVYPYLNKLAYNSKEKAVSFIKKLTRYVGTATFLISTLLLIFAKPIVEIVLGRQYMESVTVLRILSFLIFLIALSNIFGILTMLTFDYKRAFSRILVIAGLLNIILALFLAPHYKHIGISIAVLITESFVTIAMYLFLRSKGVFKMSL